VRTGRGRLCAAAAVAAVAVSLAASGAAAAPATQEADGQAGPPKLNASAWLLVDTDDGERLAAHDPSKQVAIASTTKLMTAYLALEELPLKRKLAAPAYSPLPAESILGLREGERTSVRDLLYSLVLASANDAAVTLAVGASGSVADFVSEMNDAADQLGLRDTSYTNPIGLDDPGNRSSARDLVTLAQRLMQNPLFRRIADTESATIHTDQRDIQIATRNTLLLGDPTATGIKTGHTLDAGYVLVGSATRDDVSLMSVVLGAPSEAERDADTEQLFDYGYSLYGRRTPVKEGEALAAPELTDQNEDLDLVPEHQVRVAVRDDEQVATQVEAPDEVEGPIAEGERLGSVTVTVDGREVDSVPLVAARSADAATTLEKLRARVPVAAAVAALAFVVILIAVLLARRRTVEAPRTPESRTAEERMRRRNERMRRREGEGP
jgi:serine-type D-Ala-D-Ala carboxypeptidase (penicillin-binding protein 5/6)